VVSSAVQAHARDDIERMSETAASAPEFLALTAAALRRAVPSIAGCVSTLDPATAILTGVTKYGALSGRNEADVRWAQIEYGEDDPTAMRALVAARRTAIGVRNEFDGEVQRSVRMAELLLPDYGFGDEARVVFADAAGAWGSMSMFRGTDDAAFSPDDLQYLETIAPAVTRGIRRGLIAAAETAAEPVEEAAAVVILDGSDRIVRMTPGARHRLRALAHQPSPGDPLTILHSLVWRARRAVTDRDAPPARVRARTARGGWLLLRATTLEGGGGQDVAVAIDDARPQDVADLIGGALGLTARERDVFGLVLRGSNTREIAATLFLSPYTVQDHLKAIFDKAGVGSRRQLVAKVYFDHYAPGLR
jgi:DNA-binding CsgD family transcriptional regulator